jgi:hypothetical protein
VILYRRGCGAKKIKGNGEGRLSQAKIINAGANMEARKGILGNIRRGLWAE